jgi:hypothetical protein
MRQHPGRGGLAVRAGDRDEPPGGADLGQQLPAVEHALAALAGDRKLGVFVADRGGHDDLRIEGHRLGVVTDRGVQPRLPQVLHIGAVGPVGAADGRAQPVADERQAAHPGAADRDEVQLAVSPVGHRSRRGACTKAALARGRGEDLVRDALRGVRARERA